MLIELLALKLVDLHHHLHEALGLIDTRERISKLSHQLLS